MNLSSFFQRNELTETLGLLRREFVVCVILTMVVNLLMLTPPWYMLQIFDRVLPSQNELTLIALTLVMLFLYAVMAFAEWSRTRLLVRTGVKLDEQLNSRVFNASFEAHLIRYGENSAQPISDLTNLRQFLTGHGLFAILDAPWTPIYVAVLFLLHPLLGWLSIFFSLLLAALSYLGQRRMLAPLDKAMELLSQLQAYVQSKLKNAEIIESLGMLGDLRSRWLSRHQQCLRQHHEAQDVGNRMQAVSKFLRYTQQSLALGAGALLVIQGELSPGAMIAANVLMGRAMAPIDQLVSTWKAYFSARKSYQRLAALLARHPQRDAGSGHAVPTGHLRIEDLVASVPGRAEPILKGLNAEIPAGAVIVVTGPSGSGKTTLARCLVGIWPDLAGTVLLDGVAMQSWNRGELGPFLGYLPQDIELFDGTIAENIARFGKIDPAKVIQAAERAGVHRMVLRLPRGYDTPVGDGGSLLSGGQRQRIGLARALYGDPSVIVLDEPNSNLDDDGEAALLAALQDLKALGRTVILITHRSHIIGVADRLLTLVGGALVHDGPAREYREHSAVLPAGANPAAATRPDPGADARLSLQPL